VNRPHFSLFYQKTEQILYSGQNGFEVIFFRTTKLILFLFGIERYLNNCITLFDLMIAHKAANKCESDIKFQSHIVMSINRRGGIMATDIEKSENMFPIQQIQIFGVTKELWNFVEDSAFALSPKMGVQILNVMENEMGLNINGNKPVQVLNKISQLFIDEFSIAEKIEIEELDNVYRLKVHQYAFDEIRSQFEHAGVNDFICPVMNASVAALRRLNLKVRSIIEKDGADFSNIDIEVFEH